MKNKLIIGLLMVFLPLLASAQGAGGQIRRPVKKTKTETVRQRKTGSKQNAPSPSSWKPTVEKPQKSSSESILQRLIANMVYVEGGTFMMGATTEQGQEVLIDEKPVHQVMVSSFYIGKYEVTQEEWEAVMESNPSEFKGAKRPVENMSWSACRQFLRRLKSLTGKNFRMLTEAEWEYAARGGNRSREFKYSGSNILDDVGWYEGNSSGSTHDVGLLDPNELGLYDMSGNVFEWCLDWYGSYESIAQDNPSGPSSGSERVIRGGCWGPNSTRECRVSSRCVCEPGYQNRKIGLRLAL